MVRIRMSRFEGDECVREREIQSGISSTTESPTTSLLFLASQRLVPEREKFPEVHTYQKELERRLVYNQIFHTHVSALYPR